MTPSLPRVALVLIAQPLQQNHWPAYEAFFRDRGRPLPPREGCEPIGVFDGDTLIAACGLYDTSGPFILVEALAADPAASSRQTHAAILELFAELDRLAHDRHKVVCGWSGHYGQGLAAIARRVGGWSRPVTAFAANVSQIRRAS